MFDGSAASWTVTSVSKIISGLKSWFLSPDLVFLKR
jgi:hypothetical protein